MVQASVTELPESRVRVQAHVPAEEVERRVQAKARDLGRNLKLPGFRRGKLPPALVIQRMGRDAVLDETIRDGLARWYDEAIRAAGVEPVGEPDLDIGDPPGEGEALEFSIEIGVRPTATLGEWRGLEVGRREPAIEEADLERELEALRERLATLAPVERAAQTGDFLLVDYLGTIDGVPFEGGEGRDQMIELGSGRLIPGFEEQLVGAGAGDQRTVEVSFPDDYGAAELAGRPAAFAVTVKEVREKVLPALDDDLAIDAGFDDLAQLRDDVRERLRARDEEAIDAEFREAALDAAVAEATVDVPEALAKARARELWDQTLHALAHRGISREAYLSMAGRDEEAILADALDDAAQTLRREAVVAAIVDAEAITPDDDALAQELAPLAERRGTEVANLIGELRSAGRLDELRGELARRQAVDMIVAAAKPIAAATAAARDKLWTPGKGEESEAGGRIWTPSG